MADALSEFRAAPLPKGRHSLSREEVEHTQRVRLLIGLADALADEGYAATPVAEILKRAGVSRQTFYQLYDNKLDCFLDALDFVGEILLGHLSQAVDTPGEPLNKAAAAVDTYLRVIAQFPTFARLFIVEAHGAGVEAMSRRAELQHRIIEAIADLLGANTADDHFACEMFVGAVSALVTLPLVTGDTEGLDRLRDPLVAQLEHLADQIAGN